MLLFLEILGMDSVIESTAYILYLKFELVFRNHICLSLEEEQCKYNYKIKTWLFKMNSK